MEKRHDPLILVPIPYVLYFEGIDYHYEVQGVPGWSEDDCTFGRPVA